MNKEEPDNVPSAKTVQTGAFESTPPLGIDMYVQAPAAPKLLPVTVTVLPTRTFVFGVSVIFGTTVSVAVAKSPAVDVTVIVFAPAVLPGILRMKEPVATPPDMEHEGVPSKVLGADEVKAHPAAVVLKPEPENWMVSPPVPVVGESDI
jgi:hypothetical protein